MNWKQITLIAAGLAGLIAALSNLTTILNYIGGKSAPTPTITQGQPVQNSMNIENSKIESSNITQGVNSNAESISKSSNDSPDDNRSNDVNSNHANK
jgi:hypothetical protein